jgi:hypothetical protein
LLAEVPQEEIIRLKPEDINPRKPEPLNPDADVIARVRGEENIDGQEIKAAAGVRSELEGADKTSGEFSRASCDCRSGKRGTRHAQGGRKY